MEIPDRLHTLFTATLQEDDGSYVIEIPESEIESGTVTDGGMYRIVILDGSDSGEPDELDSEDRRVEPRKRDSGPPVSVGELRTVTIEDIGAQGDGIARVGRGYVIIVPGAGVGEQVEVQITETRASVGFATITGK